MRIKFTVNFCAADGDALFVIGSLPQLGEWDPAKAMKLAGGPNWSAELDILSAEPFSPDGRLHIHYKYFLRSADGIIFFEAGEGRRLSVERDLLSILACDSWIGNDANAPFLTTPFTEVFFAGKGEIIRETELHACGKELVIRIIIPNVADGDIVTVCGNIPQLGMWNPSEALVMKRVAGVRWEASIKTAGEAIRDLEYKFLKNGIWEEGVNHRISLPALEEAQTMVLEHSSAALPVEKPHLSGCAIPLFSLRSGRSWGIGDFADIAPLADWASAKGLSIIQFLPINDTCARMDWHDSYPYNCISVFALHPIYIAPERAGLLADGAQVEKYLKEAQGLNAGQFVDYEAVFNLKINYLRQLYREQWCQILESGEFAEFCAENEYWLGDYAAFCAKRDAAHDLHFYKYLQYVAHRQMVEAKEYAHSKGLALKGDLPIGVARYGVESASHPQLFNFGMQAGAPPDAFSDEGQNWGFPTYNWDEMAKDNYHWWRMRLKHLSNYFDAYRIDHVLGFFRIWEIPLGERSNRGHFAPALALSAEEIMEVTGVDVLRHPELFVEDPYCKNSFHPAVSALKSRDFASLEELERESFECLYYNFYYERNENLWYRNATKKLQQLISCTGMLACAEDLGMLSPAVNRVLSELKILSLEVQNMPKEGRNLSRERALELAGEILGGCEVSEEKRRLALGLCAMGDPDKYPYLSVCTTSTHDTETLRMWLGALLGRDAKPGECEVIIKKNLSSEGLFTILPLQDWLSVDSSTRSRYPETERINVPADPNNYWRYRLEVIL